MHCSASSVPFETASTLPLHLLSPSSDSQIQGQSPVWNTFSSISCASNEMQLARSSADVTVTAPLASVELY